MRSELASAIEADLSAKLIKYNIELVSTSVENMDFTDVFTEAVEAKQVAAQNKLTAQTRAEQEVIEAEAAARVQVIQAQADADAMLAKAQAEAEATRIRAEAEAEANAKVDRGTDKIHLRAGLGRQVPDVLRRLKQHDAGHRPEIRGRQPTQRRLRQGAPAFSKIMC